MAAQLEFDPALLETARADRDAQRRAEQVGVVELDAGPLFAVVGEDVQSGVRERGLDLGDGGRDIIAAAQGDDVNVEGRDGARPDDAQLVVVGLDDGRP